MAGQFGSEIAQLLDLACRAPSGDNTQPWSFTVDAPAGLVAFRVDETRDPSPMNAGQRMARLAIGAALENLAQAAASRGWDLTLEHASPPDLAVARLSFSGPAGQASADPIVTRSTNRRVYDRRPVPAEVLAGLSEDVSKYNQIDTVWIVDPDRIAALAELIGRADALMFGEPTMRRAFLAKVRFDVPPDEVVPDGLSLGSLEVSGADRVALKAMRFTPNWVLRAAGAGRVFAAKARVLVNSASGLCLIVAPDRSETTDLEVGRAMQRAWLALTRRGFAAQPMMSLMVLENAIEKDHPAVAASAFQRRADELSRRFRELVPEIGGGRSAFLLRFGHAASPSGRTGRLPATIVDK